MSQRWCPKIAAWIIYGMVCFINPSQIPEKKNSQRWFTLNTQQSYLTGITTSKSIARNIAIWTYLLSEPPGIAVRDSWKSQRAATHHLSRRKMKINSTKSGRSSTKLWKSLKRLCPLLKKPAASYHLRQTLRCSSSRSLPQTQRLMTKTIAFSTSHKNQMGQIKSINPEISQILAI